MPKALLDYETTRTLRDKLALEAEGELNLSSNASLVFNTVYNDRLEDRTPETIPYRIAAVAIDVASQDMVYLPEGMPREQQLAHVEATARSYLNLYTSNRFRANTPTNINFGRWQAVYGKDRKRVGYRMKDQMGSACFVIPVEDTFGTSVESLEDGILEAWVTQQMIHKGGGGTGFSFDSLRPKGSLIGYDPHVDSLHSIDWDADRRISSGYESFLNHFFNPATDAVKQGNSRRGANMGIQRIDHMDFLDHLYAKHGRTRERSEFRVKNFNLSVAVTDEFMEVALAGGTYTLYNPHRASFRDVLGEDAELVRKGDIATRKQFEAITERNSANPFAPVTTPNMYLSDDGEEVINAYTGERIGRIVNDIVHIDAARVLDIISQLSHSNGEPGVVFIDRMNEYNPILFDKEISGTNPCGEQPLEAYTACNLGSINVGKYVKYDTFPTRDEMKTLEERLKEDEFVRVEERADGTVGVMYVDWDSLDRDIGTAMHFLDGVIDRSDFPGEKITRAVQETRKVGLGYMGVWDAMILMKLRYGSEESLRFAEALAKRLHDKANEASERMAEERGVFPLWETSFYNPESDLYKWFMSNPDTIIDKHRGSRKLSRKVERDRRMRYGFRVRHSYQTTEAPTGTIRRTSGEKDEELGLDNLAISSGIEPIYTLIEKSNIMNRSVEDTSWAAVQLFKREGVYSARLMEAIKANKGSVFIYSTTPPEVAEVLRTIPEDVRNVLVTAAGGDITDDSYEITNHQHTQMSLRFQRWNRSSNSKTNNLPASATTRDMRNAWVELWRGGSKGGTIYRDRSREFQILNTVGDESPGKKKKGVRRPLLQRSITLELPYASSTRKEGVGDIDFDPDRCFTTLTFNGINGHLTGVFQNIPEIDPERISAITDRNIERSRALKNGRPLDDVIADLEKIRYASGRRGIAVDEAVMGDSEERMRFQVEGETTTENELNAFYIARFLTEGGTNLDPKSMQEKIELYERGVVTLRSIINTKGRLTVEEGSNGNPSILGRAKVVKIPEDIPANLCPECG